MKKNTDKPMPIWTSMNPVIEQMYNGCRPNSSLKEEVKSGTMPKPGEIDGETEIS
jgi:hypothetical protein